MHHATQASLLYGLGVSHITRFAFQVDDIEKNIAEFSGRFNISTWYYPHITHQALCYRGQSIPVNVSTAIGYAGPIQVELFVVDDGRGSLFERRKKTPNRLHHLGCHVRDSSKITKMASARGISPIQTQSIEYEGGININMVFLDTAELCGLPLALLETRFKGIPMRMSRMMMNIHSKLGICSNTIFT